MMVTFELWHLLSVAGAIAVAFAGLGKLLLLQFERNLAARFDALEKDSASWRELERDFLTFRAELPEKYVRREDYIRGQTVIEAKLDAISSEVKVVQIQGAKRAN